MTNDKTEQQNAAEWQKILAHEHRTVFAALPSDPRCQICSVPFAGFGGLIGRAMGFKKWNKNPSLCNRCVNSMPEGGIEIDTAILFADIRGSTALGEKLGPGEFAQLLNLYYKVANSVLAPRKAVIDKMIGDEVMALFLPLAGPAYRRVAVESAIALQQAVKGAEWPGERPGVGIGVYAGNAFIGRVGEEAMNEFTALGDSVNVAGRLQSEAAPGQVVISEDLYAVSSDLLPDAEHRTITVAGRAQPVDVRVVTA